VKRRTFLGAVGTAALGAAGGCALSFEQGLFNPCPTAPLAPALREHELVRAAWDGIDAAQCWDCHVHLAGVGDSGSGVWISPQLQSLWHPWQSLQRKFYLNAACTERAGHIDDDYVRRLLFYLDAFPRGAKAMLLAFDYHHDESGSRREDLSAFHVPDRYAAALAHRDADRFEWICSVHPYRPDALDAIAWAVAHGARAVKWLPSAMGIDPAAARCDRFYRTLAHLDLPLLSHAGAEIAVHGAAADELNNPLRLRRALERGVRVIVAHCAPLGEYRDLDSASSNARAQSFALFTRLMDEPRYIGRLFGEISALTQANRMGTPLATIVARRDWHARLLNGSDYPLPGVMPLYSMRRFVDEGYLTPDAALVLTELRRHNPLLFEFVLKRSLRAGTARLAASIFETRRVFGARAGVKAAPVGG
jgi:predicted TIM-barrel fold metal-dependent hydrolase